MKILCDPDGKLWVRRDDAWHEVDFTGETMPLEVGDKDHELVDRGEISWQ